MRVTLVKHSIVLDYCRQLLGVVSSHSYVYD